MREYEGAQILFDPDNPDDLIIKEPDKSVDELFGDVQTEIADMVCNIMKEKTEDEQPVHQDNLEQTGRTASSQETAGTENMAGETSVLDKNEKEAEQKIEKETEQDGTDTLLKEIKDIKKSMLRLEKKFETDILNAETRDSTVKSMYMELQEYKKGIIQRALKDVLYDMIDLRETILKQVAYLEQKPVEEQMIPLEDFAFYGEVVGDILDKYDVNIYKGQSGVENVPIRQKIVKKVQTDDPDLVKKVAQSLSCGYEYNGKVIYPERISIYVKNKKDEGAEEKKG